MRRIIGITGCLGALCLGLACSKDTPLISDVSDTDPAIPVDTTTTLPSDSDIPNDHPIEIRLVEGETLFWNKVTDTPFTPRGTNYFWIVAHDGGYQDRFFAPGDFDPSRARSDFRLLAERGYNTVRIFLDTCSDGPACIGNDAGTGLNPEYIETIVQTLEIAKEEGVFLLLTSNDLPDSGGYWDLSNEGASAQFESYRNAHYLTQEGIASAQRYWGDLLKALTERNAAFESVFAWSLLNEQWYFKDKPPFSLNDGFVTTANGTTYDMANGSDKKAMAVEGMVHYIDKVMETINLYDSGALVTMGFFAPDYPNPYRPGDFRYVETADLLYRANLDFFDFHTYPGDLTVSALAENFGMLGYGQKPIIMGEYGAFQDRYPTLPEAVPVLLNLQAESCGLGFDGWLHWGLYAAPIGIGDATWGLLSEDQTLLESLAPITHPDVCDENLLLSENIALNKPATASAHLADETPAMGVDGNITTQWGSGEEAPQWFQVDLETEYEIGTIALRAAQFPAGVTTHLLEGSVDGMAWTHLETFAGTTEEGDLLIYRPITPERYRYIRITTTESPSWVSWKEIEVLHD